MPSNYNESLKSVYENTSFDAGIDGWDANIQQNNVKTRRIAASSPFSLIARVSNFTAAGQAWNSTTRYIPMMDLTGDTARLMFVPTAIGYIQHSGTAYSAITDRAVISVAQAAAGPNAPQYYATSHAFAIAPSAVANGAVLTGDVLQDFTSQVNGPANGAIDFGAGSTAQFPRLPRQEPLSIGNGGVNSANPPANAYSTTFGSYTVPGNYIFCPVAPLMTVTPALVNNASWTAAPGSTDALGVWNRLVSLFGFNSTTSGTAPQLPNLVNIHRPSIPFRPVTLGGDPTAGFPINGSKVYNSTSSPFSQLGLHYTGANTDAKIALLDIYGLVLFESA